MTDTSDRPLPRLAPRQPLPPYAYVPGRFPHPTRDPEGHHCSGTWERVDPPDPRRWAACEPYLYGLDLFNRGYYWEAHEAWEALWQAAGRRGATADFLHGLIHLAATGVKAKEGRPRGVVRHARRAVDAFRMASGSPDGRLFGLSLPELIGFAEELARAPGSHAAEASARGAFDRVLLPS